MVNVAIVGISGYTGLELIKLLINHSVFNINYIANSEGGNLEQIHPSLKDVFTTEVSKANPEDIKDKAELVFLALPHKTAMSFAKELLSYGLKVVDLSADYRLKLDTYEKYYCNHLDKNNLKQSVYGLVEYFRDDIKNTNLVANPGCYPTATLLGILPFIDYIDDFIFVDAKSGVSGAGKKLNETTQFVTINENIFAYNPLNHRHTPEIKEKIEILKNKSLDINFVPHLLPTTRGMLVSIYTKLKKDINPKEILQEAYLDEEFIRIFDKPVDIKSSSGTHFCDIYATSKDNYLFVSSSIDNLLRGASSQAVVNANIMYNLDENLSIPKIAYVP